MFTPNALVWLLTIAAAGSLLLAVLTIRAEVRRTALTTARFPLFAVRDELVRIAVDGEMDEADPAWRHFYLTVNAILGMHPEFNIYTVTRRLAEHVIIILKNKDHRARQELLDTQIDEAIEKVPSFKAVVEQMERAYDELVHARSSGWDKVRCFGYLTYLRLWVFVRSGMRRRLSKPDASDLAACLGTESVDTVPCLT